MHLPRTKYTLVPILALYSIYFIFLNSTNDAYTPPVLSLLYPPAGTNYGCHYYYELLINRP
jgi:hypothetical protein